LHLEKFSNFLFFQPQCQTFTKNQINSLVWIQFCWCVIFGFGDWGEKKKICNSVFLFSYCDIESFREIFPLKSEISRNYTRKWHSSKISQKKNLSSKKRNFSF
jgi:hypothetical protein